jgi:LmbE family N-acetylglucosaminyl deacetylase
MSGLRLMSVHAHADDESITMGGLVATSSASTRPRASRR